MSIWYGNQAFFSGTLKNVFMYHIGVGLCVARLDGMGDARASECGTSDKSDSHAFFVSDRIWESNGGKI